LGIDLLLIYGQPGPRDALRRDSAELPWATKIRNTVMRIGRWELYWQPCLRLIRGADLVIVEQASKLLTNYVLFGLHAMGLLQMAFWGHGRNFQTTSESHLGEAAKRVMSRRVHWWFAYNEMSAQVVEGLGFPMDRTTIVNNAIDTEALRRDCESVTESDLNSLRRRLDIRGNDVCLYVGGMYPEKRLGYLIDACLEIRRSNSEFEMVFLGAGPDEHVVREAAKSHPWIHYPGPLSGFSGTPFFKMSKLLLMPGLVGLVVLDAFAAGIPLVTTDVPWHSPEIAYLESGVNGLIVEGNPTPAQYAAAVLGLLAGEERRRALLAGCARSAEQYTLQKMVDRFAGGIALALQASRRP
jgi:glycosyltransferase involved in cell wall biosynthesis